MTIDIFGPLRPNAIERLPATILIMVPGTKNGEIFLGPPVLKTSTWFSIRLTPPIPEPIEVPILSAFLSLTSIPESLKASCAATKPY